MKKTGEKMIIVPINESDYELFINNDQIFRAYITEWIASYPELFPSTIKEGYYLIGYLYPNTKVPIGRRRIRLLSSGTDYTIHPCFIYPYLGESTLFLSKALSLRKYNVPYSAIAFHYGKDAMFWYRLEMSLARNNLVGTTIKRKETLPQHLLVDEHHCYLLGKKIYICTVIAPHCFLGSTISTSADFEGFYQAYRKFKQEMNVLHPTHKLLTINVDGYHSTTKSMKELFPNTTLIPCFLHGFLKIRKWANKSYDAYSQLIFDKVWHCYQAKNKLSFLQRMTHLEKWTRKIVPESNFKNAILKLCQKKRICFKL